MILDLDETLVHSQFKNVQGADIVLSINISNNPKNIAMQKVYASNRPYCDEFLRGMAPFYEVIMFTASLSRYAGPLFKRLDPNEKLIDHCLYREHCTLVSGEFYVKDLNRLGRRLEDCIIIDNSPTSYMFQTENALPCTSWYKDKKDTELFQFTSVLQKLA